MRVFARDFLVITCWDALQLLPEPGGDNDGFESPEAAAELTVDSTTGLALTHRRNAPRAEMRSGRVASSPARGRYVVEHKKSAAGGRRWAPGAGAESDRGRPRWSRQVHGLSGCKCDVSHCSTSESQLSRGG